MCNPCRVNPQVGRRRYSGRNGVLPLTERPDRPCTGSGWIILVTRMVRWVGRDVGRASIKRAAVA
jgi:hypothetical protein